MRSSILTSMVVSIFAIATSGCNGSASNEIPGYVEGEFVYVSAPVGGQLRALHVQRGAQVDQAAILFELDPTAQAAQRDAAAAKLAQAQANLTDARKGQRPTELEALNAQHEQSMAALRLTEAELARQQELLGVAGGTSRQDVDRARAARDQAKEQAAALAAQIKTARLGARADQVTAALANVDAAQAQLNQAQWELDQTRQSAPNAGVITDTLYRVGEWVAAGRPIVVLLPPSNIKVRSYVPESTLSNLKVGDMARIRIDGAMEDALGSVSFIAPQLEFTPPVIYSHTMREKFVALVEIVFDPTVATRLHPGQPVDVIFDR